MGDRAKILPRWISLSRAVPRRASRKRTSFSCTFFAKLWSRAFPNRDVRFYQGAALSKAPQNRRRGSRRSLTPPKAARVLPFLKDERPNETNRAGVRLRRYPRA